MTSPPPEPDLSDFLLRHALSAASSPTSRRRRWRRHRDLGRRRSTAICATSPDCSGARFVNDDSRDLDPLSAAEPVGDGRRLRGDCRLDARPPGFGDRRPRPHQYDLCLHGGAGLSDAARTALYRYDVAQRGRGTGRDCHRAGGRGRRCNQRGEYGSSRARLITRGSLTTMSPRGSRARGDAGEKVARVTVLADTLQLRVKGRGDEEAPPRATARSPRDDRGACGVVTATCSPI